MFAAYAIFIIWQKKISGKIFSLVIIFFLTLSGLIDFFPIKNDSFVTINDYSKNPDILWIKESTPPNSLFLNSSYLYHPASLAGRKILLGWPYFAWSAGYDTNQRYKILKDIFASSSLQSICPLLEKANIDYVETTDLNNLEGVIINNNFFKENFAELFQGNIITIYSVPLSCQKVK